MRHCSAQHYSAALHDAARHGMARRCVIARRRTPAALPIRSGSSNRWSGVPGVRRAMPKPVVLRRARSVPAENWVLTKRHSRHAASPTAERMPDEAIGTTTDAPAIGRRSVATADARRLRDVWPAERSGLARHAKEPNRPIPSHRRQGLRLGVNGVCACWQERSSAVSPVCSFHPFPGSYTLQCTSPFHFYSDGSSARASRLTSAQERHIPWS